MIIQHNFNNKSKGEIDNKFVIGFVVFLMVGTLGIYLLKRYKDKKEVE
jgi:hypothetical protein